MTPLSRDVPRSWSLECAIVLTVLLVLCFRAVDQPLSQTALSRLASVAELDQSGSWYIDRPPDTPPNPFELRTIDKVQVNGRLISSKPPLMPWLMHLEYQALKPLTDWQLNNLNDTKKLLYVYVFTFCILPWSVALLVASAILRNLNLPRAGQILLLLSLAFGTQVSGFAHVLNNHLPAAAALLICVCLVYHLAHTGTKNLPVAVLAGVLAGLVATFDVPNTTYTLAAGLVLLRKWRNGNWLAYAVGAVLPIAAQSWLLFDIAGSILPVQLRPELYFYESSYWRNPLGVDALSEPKGTYLFNMTFGNRGIFLLFPIMALALVGSLSALRPAEPDRGAVLLGLCCFAIVLGYYTASTSNYGGEVYGMRWLIPSMPIILLCGLPAWRRAERPWIRILALTLLAVSVWSAWQCGRAPWTSGAEWTRRLGGPWQ